MEPGDVERNPDGSLSLYEPPTCPAGHPLPRIAWHPCKERGHHKWWCEVCREFQHQVCGCRDGES